MMRLLPYVALTATRWKNGAGVRREIAGSNRADGILSWQIALAEVERDAEFSEFPNCDRWMQPVSAGLIELAIQRSPDRREIVLLNDRSAPYRFPGDVACVCRLLSEPVRVLNVIADRSITAIDVERLEFSEPRSIEIAAAQFGLVLFVQGKAQVEIDGRTVRLTRHDSLLADGEARRVEVAPDGEVVMVVATLTV